VLSASARRPFGFPVLAPSCDHHHHHHFFFFFLFFLVIDSVHYNIIDHFLSTTGCVFHLHNFLVELFVVQYNADSDSFDFYQSNSFHFISSIYSNN
jgi:hypothetical protein